MKKKIHPAYHLVVFADVNNDFKFLTRTTCTSEKKITWKDGKTYPLIKADISSASHPFYTGKQGLVKAAGRVDRFMKKYKIKPKPSA